MSIPKIDYDQQIGNDGLEWPQTFDAEVWAEEFCKRFPGNDLETMIGWFANAIMVGYDKGRRKE